jgi:hypothetical protein
MKLAGYMSDAKLCKIAISDTPKPFQLMNSFYIIDVDAIFCWRKVTLAIFMSPEPSVLIEKLTLLLKDMCTSLEQLLGVPNRNSSNCGAEDPQKLGNLHDLGHVLASDR